MGSEDIFPVGLTFHHVGLLVENMTDSINHYSALFGEASISETIHVSTQKVKVCFVKIAEGSYIELVQPMGEDSVVYKLLKKRTTYYHIGYKVADISSMVLKLEKMSYKAMEFFISEAFQGKKCIFLFSPEAHLIELIEQ